MAHGAPVEHSGRKAAVDGQGSKTRSLATGNQDAKGILMKKLFLVAMAGLFLVGCAPSLFITPAATAPDGTEFWSVVTKSNGHPAVTSVQTFNKSGDKSAKMVADHSGAGTGAAVAITSSALQGTGAALALGLPAALIRPDQTNVTQTGGGGSTGDVSAGATGGLGVGVGLGGKGGAGGAGGAGGKATAISASVSNSSATATATAKGGKFTPPGQDKPKK